MNAKEFFDLVSSYYAHREHAEQEYNACKTDAERQACHRNHKGVIETKWALIVNEVRRVHQAQAIVSLTEEQETLENAQKILSHIIERIRINGCELEYLKKERERLTGIIRQKSINTKQ